MRRLGHQGGGGAVSDRSSIEWTEATWNPTTGCDRVSAGCDNCYALTLAKRLKAMGSAKYQNDGDPRTSGPGFGLTVHPQALRVPLGWRSPRTVFVNSMSDLFHARVPLDYVQRVFDVMASTPQHTYQVLTKRARRLRQVADRLQWPANLWMGVSVESTKELPRVDDLRLVPASVRFLSCEPLLGPLRGWTYTASTGRSSAASPAQEPGRWTWPGPSTSSSSAGGLGRRRSSSSSARAGTRPITRTSHASPPTCGCGSIRKLGTVPRPEQRDVRRQQGDSPGSCW